MGGLWVDYERDARGSLKPGSPRNHSTNIPGLYAVGEVDYQYHGANRLGANSLLSCIDAGMVAGPAIAAYRQNLARSSWDVPSGLFDKAEVARPRSSTSRRTRTKEPRTRTLHQDSSPRSCRDSPSSRQRAPRRCSRRSTPRRA
jgi:succinate dehydrogenase / fumarate reductase flavoprotein subunit